MIKITKEIAQALNTQREVIERLLKQLDELQNEKNNLCNDIVDLNLTIENKERQLNEANKALKEVCMHCETEHFECRCGWVEPCKDCNAHYAARDYLEKWGVK